jgi:phosphoribosylanthranilate isomerase
LIVLRVKICGITRVADAFAAAEAGADAIGLVFARSPRQVSISKARQIVDALPPFVSPVGVFVNTRAATILRVAREAGLTHVQLHGDEPPGIISALRGLRIIKALRVRSRSFIDELRRFRDTGVAAILLDAFSTTARGGSGRRFDWDLVSVVRQAGVLDDAPPLILAGGLTPQNVRAGLRAVRPWGVDVSTGVEKTVGVKSPELIERFIAAARGNSRAGFQR